MSETGTSREVGIEGQTWHAVRCRDGRFRLYQPHWGDSDPTRLPAEYGRCSYCLDEDTHLMEDKSTVVCEACGERETIVCTEAMTVSEVRTVAE